MARSVWQVGGEPPVHGSSTGGMEGKPWGVSEGNSPIAAAGLKGTKGKFCAFCGILAHYCSVNVFTYNHVHVDL